MRLKIKGRIYRTITAIDRTANSSPVPNFKAMTTTSTIIPPIKAILMTLLRTTQEGSRPPGPGRPARALDRSNTCVGRPVIQVPTSTWGNVSLI